MEYIIKLVRDILAEEEQTAEIQVQLNKICELEDKFIKDYSKEKWKEYFDLDLEKGHLHSLQIDNVIKLTFLVCKSIFL